MTVTSNKRQFWSLIGIGFIVGCFSNLMVFLRFGVDGLWGLSVLGVCALVLFFLQKVKQPSVQLKPDVVDNESKTLVNRLRVWRRA